MSGQLTDAVEVGKGWLTSNGSFTADKTEPGRKIYYGRKRYVQGRRATTKYIHSYVSGQLTDAVEVGKGWLTSNGSFTADKTEPGRKIYYGRKRYVQGSSSTTKYMYSYVSGQLTDAVEVGKGWLTSRNRFTADTTESSRKIYYGRKRYVQGSSSTTKYMYSYVSGQLTDAVEVGKGWLTSRDGFTADTTESSRKIYYGRKPYVQGSSSTTKYIYSYVSGQLTDAVEVGKGWLTSSGGFIVDYAEAPRSIYSGNKTYREGLRTNTVNMFSHIGKQLSSPTYAGFGWIRSTNSFRDASTVGDRDNDGLIDLAENQRGTSNYSTDTDSDGISDYDEVVSHLTDPLSWDTDGDTLMDRLEIRYSCLDPLSYNDPDEISPTTGLSLRRSIQFDLEICGTGSDSDNDQINDLLEVSLYGTKPRSPDSDQDGVADGEELSIGLNPLISDSYRLDGDRNHDNIDDSIGLAMGIALTEDNNDGDGLTNARESALGTNPMLADSDGDGVNDGIDEFPLDPNMSARLIKSSDTTSPVINLQQPPHAIAL